MRRTLLALPFALLPLALAQADEHQHGSLAKHQHGIASLNVALDGNTLEIQLESPAMNIVGFEHAASSEADQALVAAAKAKLEQPLQLFNLPAAADCSLTQSALHSPLFASAAHTEDAQDADGHGHSDVDADYSFHCNQPDALQVLDLSALFIQFPATHRIAVQLIGRSGQQGAELSPKMARLSF
ncbi:DUF2796 domain-containing protein [Pseudomonas sp. SA3-5]|uniref:DUF2796 domain-containing protein n=1 Tax=Pseudomonas aestuarii TaxID=3018340 RepID=A0ABT4XIY5_9PSED|nr:DUF2796 domain-containing protein [Pseudomonas aestuarii]MDA7088171.1 DUF2796 domain-containing protein [Pseudomonas aestuarii]